MADSDQMSRKDLLEAQAKVQGQIETLRRQMTPGFRLASKPLMAKLTAISEEIANRLAELDASNA